MSILVTGTAGFIGSVVSRILLESGESVVGVDNLNNSYNPLIKEWRLEQSVSYTHLTLPTTPYV